MSKLKNKKGKFLIIQGLSRKWDNKPSELLYTDDKYVLRFDTDIEARNYMIEKNKKEDLRMIEGKHYAIVFVPFGTV